ncbi:MAG: AtpZ/AtpI family protein [Oligoflexia bacterium]|nr:AtpZ/AtpI family protein [Oligoflexia bacterium]
MSLRLDADLLKRAGIVGFITTEIIVYVGVTYYLGSFLDQKAQTGLVFTFVLTIVGLSLSIFRIYRMMKKTIEQDNKKEEK